MTTTDTRAEFEKAYRTVNHLPHYFKFELIDGYYVISSMQRNFDIWNACQKLNDARISELMNKLSVLQKAIE